MAEQQIRFCTSKDGVSIAYATTGQGYPLVKAANWLGHLQFDLQGIWNHWITELSRYNLLVRFDQRGCGLSDRTIRDFTFERCVDDLEAVVDSLGLEQFDLLGMSHGGSVSIAYAVRHPRRVKHLILYGAFARGGAKIGLSAEKQEQMKAVETLMRSGWGRDDPAFRQIFTSWFMPDATAEQMRAFNEYQKVSASPENAVQLFRVIAETDVFSLLSKVSVPTIVFHNRGDRLVPFKDGIQLAASIPNARFIPLESRNHILLEYETAWKEFLIQYRRFLGVGEESGIAVPSIGKKPNISTGYAELDRMLGGGVPEGYGVVLVSQSFDETDLLVRKIMESALASAIPIFYLSTDIAKTRDMINRFGENFFALSPIADKIEPGRGNLFKVPDVGNLSDLSISANEIIQSKASDMLRKMVVIDLLSDLLLRNKALATRKWLTDFTVRRKAAGFTILATLDPSIAPKEDIQIMVGVFDGVVEVHERMLQERARRFLVIKKMYSRDYSDEELMLDKRKLL